MSDRVLLVGFKPESLADEHLQRIRDTAPEMRLLMTRERGEIEANLTGIEVIVGGVPRDLLPKMPALRWFQQWGAGADWLMKHPEVAALDFTLTNVSGIHAVPISEHILALLLAFARGLPQAQRAQARREWQHDPEGLFELEGKTMLLLGMGPIARRTAGLASVMGMRVVGVRRNPAEGVPGVAHMVGTDTWHEYLPEADVLVLTVPLTRETEGMVGDSELRAMKRSAYLINIGRGGTVQEGALVTALREGVIAGAGLDVFEEEPLPQASPLWEMDNVIITAHYSGDTPHYNERALAIFLDNLKRYREGESLHHVVDKQRGY